jgi:hypothetical protein
MTEDDISKFFENKQFLEESFPKVEISNRNGSYYFYITFEHDKHINKIVKIKKEIKLVSFLSFGFYLPLESPDLDLIPINVYVSFAWFSEKDSAYPAILPKGANLLNCPQNYQIRNRFFWKRSENKFYKKFNNEVNITKELNVLYKMHILALKPIKGLILRIKRFLYWYPITYGLKLFAFLLKKIFYLSSGKNIGFKPEEHVFNYFMNEAKRIELHIVEEEGVKVTFFGMQVYIIPVITFSIIHFALYTLFYFIKYKPEYIKNIINNAFLTTIYVIVSISIMQFVLSKIVYFLCDIAYRLIKLFNRTKSFRYD